jgi:hypothetical protein
MFDFYFFILLFMDVMLSVAAEEEGGIGFARCHCWGGLKRTGNFRRQLQLQLLLCQAKYYSNLQRP